MKTKTTAYSRIATLVAGIVLTSAVFALPHPEGDRPEPEFGARNHHRGGEPCPERRLTRMQQQLSLTDAQVAAIKAIMDNSRQQADAIRENIKPLKESLHQTLTADEIDEAAVRTLSQQLAEKKADLMLLRSKTEQQIKAQLTEQQAAEFDAIKSERKEKSGRGKGRKRGGHGPARGE